MFRVLLELNNMDPTLLLKFVHLSFLILLTSNHQLVEALNSTAGVGQTISRRKRFVVFPKGSSFQMVYCFLTTAYGTPKKLGLFTIGITLGLAWEIPQDPRPFLEGSFSNPALVQRRHRRDLFPKVETFLDKYGVAGRACILRAICESKHHTKGNGTFMDEIFHTLFSFPVLSDEIEDSTSIYDEAHQKVNCEELISDCPTSIIDLDFSGTSDRMDPPKDDT